MPLLRTPGRVRHPAVADAIWLAVPVLAVAWGCRPAADVRPDDIRSYAVPKTAEPAALATGDEPSKGPAAAQADRGAAGLRYEVPDGWTDAGASGMRLATLLIGPPADRLEVTVIPASGTLAGNVEHSAAEVPEVRSAPPPPALAVMLPGDRLKESQAGCVMT